MTSGNTGSMKSRNRPCLFSILSVLFVAPAFTVAAAAQSSGGNNEFWPEFDFFIQLNQDSRIFAMYTATKSQDLGAYANGQAGCISTSGWRDRCASRSSVISTHRVPRH